MSEPEPTGPPAASDRRYARVETSFEARIRLVAPDELDAIERRLAAAPSVWSPSQQDELRKLSAQSGTDAVLANALLEVTREFVKLQSRLTPHHPESVPATVVNLSGGGGRLVTPIDVSPGDLFEMRFLADATGVPPVEALIEIVSSRGDSPPTHGFRLIAIHPRDKDRLIRHTYRVQRAALRKTKEMEED